jgi:hypothetical protein
MRLTDLPRNDVPAALGYCRERDWQLTEEEAQMLLMLQDHSAVLIQALSGRLTVLERAGTL